MRNHYGLAGWHRHLMIVQGVLLLVLSPIISQKDVVLALECAGIGIVCFILGKKDEAHD